MKRDKALLTYKGNTQVENCIELLTKPCDKVFISKRPDQNLCKTIESFPVIEDRFLEFGPLGGILSAMVTIPNVSWLVLACDLPFLTSEVLLHLIRERNPFKMASLYKCRKVVSRTSMYNIYYFHFKRMDFDRAKASIINDRK